MIVFYDSMIELVPVDDGFGLVGADQGLVDEVQTDLVTYSICWIPL